MPQTCWGVAKATCRIGDMSPLESALSGPIVEGETSFWRPGSDFWPFKRYGDVVVRGKAFARAGLGHRVVSVRVGQTAKRLRVFGRRYVEWSARRGPRLGAPEEVSGVELGYANAYGGFDRRVPTAAPTTFWDALRLTGDHPGTYPRNQSGKGYLVVDSPIDGVELPNLEDPDHLLTAENLIVKDPALW